MKPVDQQITSVASADLRESFFTMTQESLPMIFHILRNQLYSNKELAVVREISSNAFDAMVEAGKGQEPFIVTLPLDLDPTFRVRDFGNSLTDDEVRKIFAGYGISTKRGSNDYVGMLGLGSKSPFSYTDSFTVEAFQGGKKRSYTCYLDESGLGKVALLSEDDTDEKDGTAVTVSVRQNDISKFQSEANKFFYYWRNRPTFEGYIPTFSTVEEIFKGKNGDWIIPSKDTYNYHTPVAIMGNVAYPLNSTALDWTDRKLSLKTLLTVGIRLWMDIGDLEVSASRESLQYSKQTQEAIFAKLEQAHDELVETVNNQMTSCKSMYEAKILFTKVFDLSSPLYMLKDLFANIIQINGKPITHNHWDGDSVIKMGAQVRHYHRNDTVGKRARFTLNNRIYASETQPIIINDLGTDAGMLNRIAALIELDNNALGRKFDCVQVVSVKDSIAYTQWKQDFSFDAPTIKLSSLPKNKLKDIYHTVYANTYGHNPKNAYDYFTFEIDKVVSRSRGESNAWEPSETEHDDEGVYLVIERYRYKDRNGNYSTPTHLKDVITDLENVDVVMPEEIIGIKASEIDKKGAPPKMVKFTDYVKAELQKLIDASEWEQAYCDKEALEKIEACQFFSVYSNIKRKLIKAGLDPQHPLIVFGDKFAAARHIIPQTTINRVEQAKQWGITVTPRKEVKPTLDLQPELEELKERYSLLLSIGSYQLDSWFDDEQWKATVKNINLIDDLISKNKNVEGESKEAEGALVAA